MWARASRSCRRFSWFEDVTPFQNSAGSQDRRLADDPGRNPWGWREHTQDELRYAHPPAADQLIGVLRLRGCFAWRSSCSAQDDGVYLLDDGVYLAFWALAFSLFSLAQP